MTDNAPRPPSDKKCLACDRPATGDSPMCDYCDGVGVHMTTPRPPSDEEVDKDEPYRKDPCREM